MDLELAEYKNIIRNVILPKAIELSAATLGAFLYITFIAVLILKWVPPPTTSFMVQYKIERWWNNKEDNALQYQWREWDDISPYLKVAVITSEDQNFAEHWGFDFKAIQKAIDEYSRGEDLRGASTITQQVAKNLFLWPGKSYVRKALESYVTIMIELLWSKKHILEVYLNIAEFGEGVYGAPAASEVYFNTDVSELNMANSSLMVTALPNPDNYNLDDPSTYMIDRRNWILQYMLYLGHTDYLKRLEK